MTTFLYIIAFSLIGFIVIIIIINSKSGIVYVPNDEESKIQIHDVKRILKEKWDIEPGGFWIPLNGESSLNTCYFNTNDFDLNFGFKKLSGLINQIEKGKVYSFGESNVFSQMDQLHIDRYPGLDTFYSNSNADWVIYITHEKTIAFGGSILINEMKTGWVEMDKFKNPWDKNDTDNTN